MSGDVVQDKLLNDALSNVKVHSLRMKVCLDKDKLSEAIKHATHMLTELRTSVLSPKLYYELYICVTEHLQHLESYLSVAIKKDDTIFGLYEEVQYGNLVLPRLYLMITVGLVNMKTSNACRKEILQDLVEMCQGVQHPLRGLFLRNYLLQSCRRILPDTVINETGQLVGKLDEQNSAAAALLQKSFVGTSVGQHHEADGQPKQHDGGTVIDSIEFILANFGEMNKLWVRMQHQGHSRDRERREKERQELRLLVGTNLVRLSQLESVETTLYKRMVLPGILEQVVCCKDAIAQEYLMESLIQVFPDEFHLATLSTFLYACAQLAPEVKIKNIVISMVDRLANAPDIEVTDDLCETFRNQVSNIISSRETITVEEVLLMQGSLINFSMKKIADDTKREESIDAVLEATLNAIEELNVATIFMRSNVGTEMYRFLKLPFNLCINSSSSNNTASCDESITTTTATATAATSNDSKLSLGLIKMSLKLSNFRALIRETVNLELHKQVLTNLVMTVLDHFNENDTIRDEDRLTLAEFEIFLTELMAPMVNGTNFVVVGANATKVESRKNARPTAAVMVVDANDEDFIEEQQLLARVLKFQTNCLIAGDEAERTGDEDSIALLDITYRAVNSAKKILITGGSARIRYTFPTLIFEALQLCRRYFALKSIDEKWEKKCQKIYQTINGMISEMQKDCDYPQICIRLYLEAATNASQSGITNREDVCYEFITQAFTIYEEEISDSKEQYVCLQLIINTLMAVRFESEEKFVQLRNQCCLNCGKLVKKSDQCRALLAACALFVKPSLAKNDDDNDADKQSNSVNRCLDAEVIKCFRKCIKIISTILDPTLQLQIYIEVLAQLTLYIKYKDVDLSELTVQLIELINKRQLDNTLPELTRKHLDNTLKYLKEHGLNISSSSSVAMMMNKPQLVSDNIDHKTEENTEATATTTVTTTATTTTTTNETLEKIDNNLQKFEKMKPDKPEKPEKPTKPAKPEKIAISLDS